MFKVIRISQEVDKLSWGDIVDNSGKPNPEILTITATDSTAYHK